MKTLPLAALLTGYFTFIPDHNNMGESLYIPKDNMVIQVGSYGLRIASVRPIGKNYQVYYNDGSLLKFSPNEMFEANPYSKIE